MTFTNQQVEWYFDFMKSNKSIPQEWTYNGFYDDGDHLKIYYQLESAGKRSGYRLKKETIIKDLREHKLNKLFD